MVDVLAVINHVKRNGIKKRWHFWDIAAVRPKKWLAYKNEAVVEA